MNVTLDKNGNVSGVLTISLVEEDYQDEVKKQLSLLGRRRPIKGFRPGHVPASLLKKHYGGQVTAEVVDEIVSRELTNYIRENNIDLLGEPMLSKDTKVDLVNEKNFEFKFDLGFAPEFELKLDKRVKVPYYNIEVSQAMVDDQSNAYKKRFGTQVPGDVSTEDALLRGSMEELDKDGNVKDGGIKVERTIVSPKYLKDEVEKAKFVGLKVNDTITFNPRVSSGSNVTEMAAMLAIDKDQAENVESDFTFKVEEILVNKDAELGQELYDMVFGKDVVKTEEDYYAKIKEMLAGQLKSDSNYRFTIDAEKVLVKKVGELELPDEFLKRYLMSINKDTEPSKIEEEYPRTRGEIVWQLIKEKVAKQYDVKIEKEDQMRLARIYAAQQAQYGMTNLPDEVIDKYAHEFLEKREYSEEIQNRAFEDKVFATIRDNVSLTEKDVTAEEFNKLFEAK